MTPQLYIRHFVASLKDKNLGLCALSLQRPNPGCAVPFHGLVSFLFVARDNTQKDAASSSLAVYIVLPALIFRPPAYSTPNGSYFLTNVVDFVAPSKTANPTGTKASSWLNKCGLSDPRRASCSRTTFACTLTTLATYNFLNGLPAREVSLASHSALYRRPFRKASIFASKQGWKKGPSVGLPSSPDARV